ncbi:MAG: methionine--tRNA ligase [Candidatus Doudnabacteria bacterium]|nr:methionine--tRNA ligase [Candidatus Doudnabacteria bacterium]
MNKNKFYITTTLPYVNSDPHLGFALEMVQADVIARYHKEILGQEVFFNTGTDEHGQKIFQKAESKKQDVQAYVDEYAEKFKQLMPALGISPDIHFVRTTDANHIAAAQEFWKRCEKNGDIYKKNYKIKYCVGCELEKTESELVDGKCPLHPNLELEIREEENYFFRWSKYQQQLLDLYEKQPDFVIPDFRFNEIKEFVKKGLEDFSVSRLKEKMSWGVPVPGDEAHVMYVWFDALINYISTLGWPESEKSDNRITGGSDSNRLPTSDFLFAEFWPGVQIAGKDNLRQQSAMWQAMLMSAGLTNSKQIIIHGFITSGGQKMSKSLGNVADPYEILAKLESLGLTKEQATDALRYYLLREIPTFEDGDYTWEHFVETYNAGLANGIGNLTSRILKMAVNAGITKYELRIMNQGNELLNHYELAKATDEVWKKIQACDQYIQKEEPFKKIKVDEAAAKKDIEFLLSELEGIAQSLKPFLPNTAGQILLALKDLTSGNIPRLFPRI